MVLPLAGAGVAGFCRRGVVSDITSSGVQQFFDRLATQPRDGRRILEAPEPRDRRAHHVVRVGRTERLGQHVLDSGRLDHRAYRAAGDDPRTIGRRLEQHATGAEAPGHLVRHRRALERHLDQRLLGRFDALLDSRGHFLGLADAEPDVAGVVANNDQGAERQVLAALDHLGDAVDGHDGVLQLELARVDAIAEFVHVSPQNSRPASRAASATARTRPWYRNPPRSNTTRVMPLSFRRCARARPTAAAPLTLPPRSPSPSWPLMAGSVVLAEATVVPLASS